MPDIQFDEDQEFKRSVTTDEKPYFVRLVLSTGIVATDEQANYVLLGLAVFLIILAFIIPSFFGSSKPSVPQSVIDATMKVSPVSVP